ncbi:MAG: histidine phosphatase family protein [Pseudomonadota bacterium]
MTRAASCRFFLALLASLSVLVLTPPAVAVQQERAALLQELQAGTLVIYFRHGATTWSGIDRIDWPRERQRLLSDRGIAQSELIGQSFRDLGLPVGEVLASPFARCRDMAEIAFGRVEERMELIGLLSDSAGRAARTQYLEAQVARSTEGAGNRVIVSHRSNISSVAGVALGEGDAVVLRPSAEGGFEVLETLAPEDWAGLASADQ